MPDEPETRARAGLGAAAGLCGQCRHAIIRPTKRGTVYLRCGLAAVDDRFARYPRLPVLDCPGYQPDRDLS